MSYQFSDTVDGWGPAPSSSVVLTCRACGVEPLGDCAMPSQNCLSASKMPISDDLLSFNFAKPPLPNQTRCHSQSLAIFRNHGRLLAGK